MISFIRTAVEPHEIPLHLSPPSRLGSDLLFKNDIWINETNRLVPSAVELYHVIFAYI
jgi:hypothetical protein